MLTKLLCLGVLALGATAQDVPVEIKYNLTGFFYPRVGRLARVQGVVQLQLLPTEAGPGSEVRKWSGNAGPRGKGKPGEVAHKPACDCELHFQVTRSRDRES